MRNWVRLVFWVSIYIFVFVKAEETDKCTSATTCSECLLNVECAWCAKQDILESQAGTPRCNKQSYWADHQALCEGNVVNHEQRLEIIEDEALGKGDSTVQIAPQKANLKLRPGGSMNVRVRYAHVEDYPVDMYFLLDLSGSMNKHRDQLSEMSSLLAYTIGNITSNYGLGFGSFGDKERFPFVNETAFNDPQNTNFPYLFLHHMSLAQDPIKFAELVKNAKSNGNLDSPEGGLEALVQAVVCKGNIGWRDVATRLIIFSTDAEYHVAGDGKLAGLTRPNDGDCHLDKSNKYTHDVIQDYPTLAQIGSKIAENAVNVIFTVTKLQMNTYAEVARRMEGAVVAELSEDSSNVVDIVRDQYNAIRSSVELRDDASSSFKVSYFSSCREGPLRETNRCENLEVGKPVEFDVNIELKECSSYENVRQTIIISPVGIQETLQIEVESLCQCDCDRVNDQTNEDYCSGNGKMTCGVCKCDPNRLGKFCECGADSSLGTNTYGCRYSNETDIDCSNRGVCVCGECVCDILPDQDKKISGKYCECDNFSCPRKAGQLCSGSDHGACKCGTCECLEGWQGNACECPHPDISCVAPKASEYSGKSYCSGKGDCICGVCNCIETEQGRYHGKYCEECPTCQSKCNEYKDCVQCLAFGLGPLAESKCEGCNITTTLVESTIEEYPDEKSCSFYDDEDCIFTFVYAYNTPGYVRVSAERQCAAQADALTASMGVILAVVLIGLLFLCAWRLFTYIQDKREYERFEAERKKVPWDNRTGNPLYKDPATLFRNPTYGDGSL